jgi:holo-[acyl-carrier protein] synthase
MIIGIGTDIIKVSRVQEKLASKILTKEEISLYEAFNSESRKQEFLAGRFAAKEAVIKALTSPDQIITLQDIIILPNAHGKPHVLVCKMTDITIHISISHEKDYAIAFCIAESLTL